MINSFKGILIACDMYLPYQWNSLSDTLLLKIDSVKFLIFALFLIGLPILIFFVNSNKKYEGSIKLKVDAKIVYLHGKNGKKDLKMIGENFRSEKKISILVFGQDIVQAALSSNFNVPIYSPKIQMGILKNSLPINPFNLKENKKYRNKIEYLMFYSCDKNLSDGSNVKPNYFFRVCKHSYASALNTSIQLTEVKKDDTVLNTKLIWVVYGIKSKFY